MTSFHFDLGNSTDGPVGFCARVKADTREEALEILKEVLPEEINVPVHNELGDLDERVEYINIYTNIDAISLANIDDEEDDDEDEAA